jgi:uncharacterized protein
MRHILTLASGILMGTTAAASEAFTLDSARAAAAQGDPQAQYYLAKCYLSGDEFSRDNVTAAKYMLQSANQGYAPAEAGMGSLYARGLGVTQDFSEALQWYRKAAAQGDALAEYCIGYAYSQGEGVPKDFHQAITWWQQSAEQGQVYAENALGQFYFHGEHYNDTNINYTLAAKWLLEAAQKDYVPSMNNLGYLYQMGLGVKRDWPQAIQWYRRAAEHGDAMAQANLGMMYESGDSVPIDKVEAYKWFLLSAEQGNVEGRHGAWEIDTNHALTPEQTAEAKQKAAQFHEWERTNQPATTQNTRTESAN